MQHEIGKVVEGKVTGITKFGAFVELEGGAVGMVHISEVSQTYVNDISEHLKEQQKVTVKILNISDDGKISLSIKKAMPQQQAAAPQRRENNNRPSDFNNRNAGNSRPPRPNNNNYIKPVQQNNKPASFEDMLSKFIQSSDEKISDLKRDKNSRRGGSNHKKPSRDYDY
jgi:S1 RNA binding domain protein